MWCTLVQSDVDVVGIDSRPFQEDDEAFPLLLADVSNEQAVKQAFSEIFQREQRIDYLVYSAGILRDHALIDTTLDEFDGTILVNLRGAFIVGREAAIVMHRQAGGVRIITIASELAYLGRASYGAYCASKAGLLGLMRSWARELVSDILVNAVAPGPIDAPTLSVENLSEDVLLAETQIPLRRVGCPEEVAAAVLFLLSLGGQVF